MFYMSLFLNYQFNGVIVTVINATALYFNLRFKGEEIDLRMGTGIVVWLLGFITTAVADCQLSQFQVLRNRGRSGGRYLLK